MSTDRYTVIPRTHSYLFNQDHVLLIKGGPTKPWAGKYNALGGHIEKGEDIIQAAERELIEETGLAPQNTQLVGIVHAANFYGKNIIMFVTKSTAASRQVQENHEGKLEWVPIKDIKMLPILDDVKPIITQVIQQESGIFTATSSFDDDGRLLEFIVRTQ